MKTITFDFENQAAAIKSKDAIARLFVKAGCPIASAELDPKIYRTAGTSYRRVDFVFSDSQKVSLLVKLTGDIYQVLVNGKVMPIKEQEDTAKAVGEIAVVLDMGRVAWQRKLSKVKTKLDTDGKRSVITRLMKFRHLNKSVAEKAQLLEEGKAQLAEIKDQIASVVAV